MMPLLGPTGGKQILLRLSPNKSMSTFVLKFGFHTTTIPRSKKHEDAHVYSFES